MTLYSYWQRVAEALAQCFPGNLARVFPGTTLRESRCILTSKVGYEVLRYFNVPAWPVAVNALIANQVWWTWYTNAKEPCDGSTLPPEAWAVEASDRFTGPANPSEFPGHVLLEFGAKSFGLLDLDFQQFARPLKQITTPPVLLLPLSPAAAEAFHAQEPVIWMDDKNGTVICFTQSKQHSWRTAPDWKRPQRALVGALIREIRRRVPTPFNSRR